MKSLSKVFFRLSFIFFCVASGSLNLSCQGNCSWKDVSLKEGPAGQPGEGAVVSPCGFFNVGCDPHVGFEGFFILLN